MLFLFVKHTPDYESFFAFSVPVRLAIAFLIIGSMILLGVLWYTQQDYQENEKRKTEAEKLARDAELFNLRQQLQPHFLFNSLNSINALIGFKPEEARHMIQQLSDFLRGTLKKDNNQWTTLEEELHHLQLYLDIEVVRFGHRLKTNIECDNDCGKMKMPAMLLQPVVENAIKFGLYDTTEAITIVIKATAETNRLIIKVINPYDAATSSISKGTGFGLSSVQRRLYLVFAQHGLLQTNADKNLFTTTLIIPQPND
jgi:two-component system LytT family sensor kinase